MQPPINRRIYTAGYAAKKAATPATSPIITVTGDPALDRARELRRNRTPAERGLWSILRTFKRQGFHFRQQARIGPYYPDFACHGAKLIIELDGSHHSEPDQARHDESRTAYLTTRGYRVLRFNNIDVLKHRTDVVDTILHALTPTRKIAPRFFDLPARGR